MIKDANGNKDSHFFLNKNVLTTIFNIHGVEISFKDGLLKEDVIQVYARIKCNYGKCPCCGKKSKSVHSTYERHLMDLPISGRRVSIIYKSRKFRCMNPGCSRHIFSEEKEGFAKRYSRKTQRALSYLEKVLIEVSSKKGANLSSQMLLPQSASTCLRIVKDMEIPSYGDLNKIGIDDYAKRKGVNYGTIIVNLETNRPVELLDSRNDDDVSVWLSEQMLVECVTRDRASSYASAIKRGAPKAIQIADKFHIIANFSEHINLEIKNSRREIEKSYLSYCRLQERNDDNKKTTSEGGNKGAVYIGVNKNGEHYKCHELSERKKTLFNSIQRLKKKGYTKYKIGQALNVDSRTVNRYYMMKTIEEAYPISVYRINYEDYIDVIAYCCKKGMPISEIHSTIVKLGFKGRVGALNKWLLSFFPSYKHKNQPIDEKTLYEINAKGDKMKIKSVSPYKLGMYVTNPEYGKSKKTGEYSKSAVLYNNIIESCDLLKKLRSDFLSFKDCLSGNDCQKMEDWTERHKDSDLNGVKAFVNGIMRDKESVMNAVKYNLTNGVVEGHVNRLKVKKREMYGRAGFELLRRKVILSTSG